MEEGEEGLQAALQKARAENKELRRRLKESEAAVGRMRAELADAHRAAAGRVGEAEERVLQVTALLKEKERQIEELHVVIRGECVEREALSLRLEELETAHKQHIEELLAQHQEELQALRASLAAAQPRPAPAPGRVNPPPQPALRRPAPKQPAGGGARPRPYKDRTHPASASPSVVSIGAALQSAASPQSSSSSSPSAAAGGSTKKRIPLHKR